VHTCSLAQNADKVSWIVLSLHGHRIRTLDFSRAKYLHNTKNCVIAACLITQIRLNLSSYTINASTTVNPVEPKARDTEYNTNFNSGCGSSQFNAAMTAAMRSQNQIHMPDASEYELLYLPYEPNTGFSAFTPHQPLSSS
jgi:hypothetical protein